MIMRKKERALRGVTFGQNFIDFKTYLLSYENITAKRLQSGGTLAQILGNFFIKYEYRTLI